MQKKLAAVLTIAIFAISIFAVVNPVSAHFTLGNTTGTYRFHANDFDPHVPGVIGYVWPGGGQNTWGGVPNFASVNNAPGYQSPYPGQKPSTLAGVNNLGNAPSTSWYQLESDAYAPFGAVLTGSTGDLIFAINATYGYTCPNTGTAGLFPADPCVWDQLAIMIPPGFSVPDASQVVTSFTNDYSNTYVTKASPYDRWAPGWTVVYIAADAGQNANQPFTNPYYNHQRIEFTSAGEWYYVRINGVTAPSEAGRYFFKVALINTNDQYLGGNEGVYQASTPSTSTALWGEQPTQFIPTQNWPVMLVKGEIDPAIITGTIRYAGYNQTLYSHPVMEAGRVEAVMTTRLDPYTGQSRPDLPLVNAVGYFNATAQGHYEVEGLAPGVYDLYASAAGYPKTLIQSGFTVLKGQSLHFDGYLQPGPVIHGNVFTKHQFGDEPWPGTQCIDPNTGATILGCQIQNQYIKIELYDAPTLNHIPDPSANMVTWSPLPCVAGGQEEYYNKRDAGYCGDPRLGANVAFPWHEYVPWNGYGNNGGGQGATGNPGFSWYQVSGSAQCGDGWTSTFVTCGDTKITDNFQDPQGVGPPQHWYVQGGTTTPFHFEFGVKGEYGAPRDLDGMVPQVYATWVNGLTPGRYYARAWTFRYVQSALDGSTFQEYYFDVTPNEWAGDVTLPIDIRLSSWVNKTVHFHNVINGITEDPIDTGAGVMTGVLVDQNGQAWSYNQTLLGYKNAYSHGTETGWQDAAFFDSSTVRHRNDLDKAKLNKNAVEQGRANIQFWGYNDTWGGENYGIPSGTYQPHIFVLGYLEENPVEWVSVTLSGNPTSISDHVYRGAGFNLTVYSIDWERPRVSRNWVWGQWGFGYGPTTTGVGYSPLPCTTLNPGGLPPNPQNTACSGQEPFTWGEGYTASGLFTNPPMPVAGNPIGVTRGTTLALGAMVGQEIDVGIYNNGSLVDFVGDETSLMADTTPTSCLFQNDTASFVQMCGGGWYPQYLDPATQHYVTYDGNSGDAFFGQEVKRLGFVGGYTGGLLITETQKALFQVAHYTPNLIPTGKVAVPGGGVYNSAVTGYIQLYPSAIPVNEQYDLRAFTYGYIQDKDYSAYAASGQVADMKINLIIGVNVTLDILFKKEHIITPTDGNMSARVRLFDDSGNIVAEWMSSEGVYTPSPVNSGVGNGGFAHAADGTTQYPFGNLGDLAGPTTATSTGNVPWGGSIPFPQPLLAYNYLPGGTTELRVLMAGIPQVPAAGQNDGPEVGFNPKGTYFMDPIITPGCDFELDCYNNPGLNWNNPGFFPNSGILGAPDYQGGWTAEVDFVRWYANNTGPSGLTTGFTGIGIGPSPLPSGEASCSAASLVLSCPGALPNLGAFGSGGNPYAPGAPSVYVIPAIAMNAFTNEPQQTPNYFPAVAGLLMGESYHIIPGTTAASGISLTEDMASGQGNGAGWVSAGWAVGHSMAVNHLGPYSQEGVWQISGAHLSGEASAIFEVDLNGYVSGNALAFTWSNEFRPLSWGLVNVVGAQGGAGLNFYTWDGVYEVYVPPGTYQFTISSPGLASQSWSVAVSAGMNGQGQNVYLEQSNIPVPEFSGLIVAAISALAASLYILRRRRN